MEGGCEKQVLIGATVVKGERRGKGQGGIIGSEHWENRK